MRAVKTVRNQRPGREPWEFSCVRYPLLDERFIVSNRRVIDDREHAADHLVQAESGEYDFGG